MSYENIERYLITCNGTGKGIKRAKGCQFNDDSDREYLNVNDISCVLGYGHTEFNKRMSAAVMDCSLAHLSNFGKEKERLVDRLMELTSYHFDKVFFAGSGGEVVDYSLKLARRATGRDGIVSFNNSLHGRSFAGAYISGTAARKRNFGTGLEHIYFWDYPGDGRACEEKASLYSDLAAIIIEPYQALGMASASKEYWQWLRAFCDKEGIVLIFDEIQTGFGKTGTLFAYEKLGIVPDILLMGKGMSNGFGLGGLLVRKWVSDSVKSYEMAGGSADNEFMCAAVNSVLDIFEKEKILENAEHCGALLRAGLEELFDEVSGAGLFLGVKSKCSGEIVSKAKKAGVLLGRSGSSILFRPPLVIKEDEVARVLEVLRLSLEV